MAAFKQIEVWLFAISETLERPDKIFKSTTGTK